MFLRGLGVAGLATGGAGIWRVMSNHVLSPVSGPAYAPWNEWQQVGKKPFEKLIRAAILAANPHNSQPWKFRLQDDVVDVYADTSRQIGVIDPFLREMYIGIGCGLENLLLAAGHAGYQWSFDQAPLLADTVLRPVVRVRLTQASKRSSELYAVIPSRHTNRGRYVPAKRLDASLIQALDDVGNSDSELRMFWFRSREEMQVFGKLVVSGTEAIIADAGQSRSSAQWMRTSWTDIQHFRDGLTYDAQVLPPAKRAMAKFLPSLSPTQADQYWLRQTRDTQVATAGMFGMIAVRDPQNLHDLIEAGRLWQRMQLFATLRGVAMQPFSQPIERRDRELQLGLLPTYANALGELQQDSSWHAVMPFRLGYPKDEALPSPRRALSSVLL